MDTFKTVIWEAECLSINCKTAFIRNSYGGTFYFKSLLPSNMAYGGKVSQAKCTLTWSRNVFLKERHLSLNEPMIAVRECSDTSKCDFKNVLACSVFFMMKEYKQVKAVCKN